MKHIKNEAGKDKNLKIAKKMTKIMMKKLLMMMKKMMKMKTMKKVIFKSFYRGRHRT